MRKTIVAVIAAVLVVSATSATAASLITSANIKDGTIQARDIKKGSITSTRLARSVQRQLRLAGSVPSSANSQSAPPAGTAGAAGAAGTPGPAGPKGDTGAAGTNGARGADGVNPAVPVDATGDGGWQLAGGNPGARLVGGELNLPAGTDSQTVFGGIGIAKPIAQLPLADLTALVYSYRVNSRPANSVVAPSIHVTLTGAKRIGSASTFTNLVFEPYYTQGAQVAGRVDARSGKWWSTNAIEGAPNRDTYVPLDTIIQANPNAKITSISVDNANSADMSGGADDVVLGLGGTETRYDFGS